MHYVFSLVCCIATCYIYFNSYHFFHPFTPEEVAPATSSFFTYEAEVTAYCPCEKCCGKWADGICANGHRIMPGDKFVAAPSDMPFGTLIDVPGYGNKVPVYDRGGAIKTGKIDVFFQTHQEALNWGRQKLTIKVYK